MASGDATNRTSKKERRDWKAAFLARFGETCNVSEACASARISRSAAYGARGSDEAFARAWDEAENTGIDALELEARRRAADGVDKPVFYQGEQVAVVREYSDVLLMFLLKAHRPQRYRDHVDVNHGGSVGLTLARVGEFLRAE